MKIYIKYQCQLFKYWYKITPRVYLIGANFFHADEESRFLGGNYNF